MSNAIYPNIDPNNPNPMGVPSPEEQKIILDYADIVRQRGSRKILEIGTYQGYTTKLLSLNCPDMLITTVDLPKDKLGIIPDLECERLTYWSEHNQLTGLETNVKQVHCDSALFDSPDRFGLIFIDGAHSYEYALADSLTALRLIQQGGIIIWHDYSAVYQDTVVKVVDWLKNSFPAIKPIPDTKMAVLDFGEVHYATT